MKKTAVLLFFVLVSGVIAWGPQSSISDIISALIGQDISSASVTASGTVQGAIVKADEINPTTADGTVVIKPETGSAATAALLIKNAAGTTTLLTAFANGYLRATKLDGTEAIRSDSYSSYNVVDLTLLMRDGGGLDINDSSATRMSITTSGSGADIDVLMSFIGGTNTRLIRMDDGDNRIEFDERIWIDGGVTAIGSVISSSNVDAGGYTLSDDGYYGDTTSDDAEFPMGLTVANTKDVLPAVDGGSNLGSSGAAFNHTYTRYIDASQSITTLSVVKATGGYHGSSTSLPSVHPKGMQTTSGYGLGVGTTAPTTNAVDINATGTITNPPAGSMRLMPYDTDDMAVLSSSGWANLKLQAIKSNALVNLVGNGAPSATYGIVYPPQTAPANPTSGWVIYTDTSDGVLYAKNSAGTVRALASP